MKLVKVEIKNYRTIQHQTLAVSDITTLIGRNNAGKSNILKAISSFFSSAEKAITPDDRCLFADDDEESTWVECTFDSLTDDEQAKLNMYLLSDNKVVVRRSLVTHEDGSYKAKFRGWVEEPNVAWLRSDFTEYRTTATWVDAGVEPREYMGISAPRMNKDIYHKFRTKYIKDNIKTLEFERKLSPTDFMGRITNATRVLPTVTFIEAQGDVSAQVVGKTSSLLNIIATDIIRSAKERPEYAEAATALDRAKALINPGVDRLELFNELERVLQGQLVSWGDVDCEIRSEVPELEKVLVDGLLLSVNDGADTPLANKGHGIQRQILFQVFRIYADYRAGRGVFQSRELPEGSSRTHIIIFEEPELYLHPQAQEQFYDDLLAVAEQDQVVLATHSNHLLRIERADGIAIVRRLAATAPSEICQLDNSWLRPGEDRQVFKDIQLLNSEIAKMFFADKIILVEGAEDYIYIVGGAERMAIKRDRRIAIVPAGSKENIPKLQRVLNGFGIPYTAVYDTDPGNTASERTTAQIVKLVREAQSLGLKSAGIHACDPNTASCYGNNDESSNDKPYRAHVFVKENKPILEFAAVIEELLTM